jgi:thiol:disulfide interchange protein
MPPSFTRYGRRLSRQIGVLVLACLGWVVAGCNARGERATESVQAPAPAASAAHRSRDKPKLTRRHDPQQPLEQFVQQHVEQAEAAGARVLVYVGASWCEPCERFHKALEAGQLDEALSGTHFLEFDADRDRAELSAAGYASKYIPLFSVPDPAGRSSGRAIAGSIKGDDAVRRDLVPRLVALLDGEPFEDG